MESKYSRKSNMLDRRAFLGLSGAAGLCAFSGFRPGAASAAVRAVPWHELGVADLQNMMASGRMSSRELVLGYLERIDRLNPLLHAILETNPTAVSTAAQLDDERRAGRVRGPLHGIPVLLKDNIATSDSMQTTAGSLALVGSRTPGDSPLVKGLRNAGAIILGKANLSEWANIRGFAPFNGWSARGGFTRNPYRLDYETLGSSSGSAVAAAAGLCVGAVGTETDGSILAPAGNNHIVGLKPSLGLISQEGVIPIATSFDCPGPMARTVTDVAILLAAMQSPSGPLVGRSVPRDYTAFLQRGSLDGARIGLDTRYFTPDYGGQSEIIAAAQVAIEAMERLGATIIETDTGDSNEWWEPEVTVMLCELKTTIAQYLARLSKTGMRTLADLIAFNQSHCAQEMKYFGQEMFEWAESTAGMEDPAYHDALETCTQLARIQGMDRTLQDDALDAILCPSFTWGCTVPAVAGYPSISLPVGLTENGTPAGVWMYGGFLEEPKLLAYAYDLEQELGPRPMPRFEGSVPPEPPDAGICAALPRTNQGQAGITQFPNRAARDREAIKKRLRLL